MKLAVSRRNACLSDIATQAASGELHLRSGAAPASTADASTGTLIATIDLPASPFAAPSAGLMAAASLPWSGTAGATEVVGHWRLYESGGTTIIAQGTASASGGGGEIELTNTSVASGDPVAVTACTITFPE